MKKNKIIITLFLFTAAVWSFPRLCLGQANLANQGSQAAKELVKDVIDFAKLGNQGYVVVQRTTHAIEQLRKLENKQKELAGLVVGIGFKTYKKKYEGTELTEEQIEKMRLKIIDTGYVLQSAISLGASFTQNVIDVGSMRIKDNTAIIADIAALAAKSSVTLGAAAMIDPTPMVNAITVLKGDMRKENLKIFLFQLFTLLEQVEKGLDEIYKLLNGARSQVTHFSNMGMQIMDQEKYVYNKGKYNKSNQDPEEQRKKKEKERKAQEKLKKVKEEILAGKTFPK